MYRKLSIMNALPKLIVLRRCWLRREQRVQSMVRVIQSTAEKAFICLFISSTMSGISDGQ